MFIQQYIFKQHFTQQNCTTRTRMVIRPPLPLQHLGFVKINVCSALEGSVGQVAYKTCFVRILGGSRVNDTHSLVFIVTITHFDRITDTEQLQTEDDRKTKTERERKTGIQIIKAKGNIDGKREKVTTEREREREKRGQKKIEKMMKDYTYLSSRLFSAQPCSWNKTRHTRTNLRHKKIKLKIVTRLLKLLPATTYAVTN